VDGDELDAVFLYDSLVETLADSVVELFCANEIVRGSWECTNAVIYAGNCAPPLTYGSSQGEDEIPPVTDWEAFRTPLWYNEDEQHQLQYEKLTTPGIVRYMLNSCGMFQDYPAISKIIRSTAFHARKIDQFQIDMAKLAFGSKGSYKNRHGSVGFNAYPNSLRNDTVASAISPNCGPDHLSNCTYYLHEDTDVRFMPYLHSLSSQLNEGIITNFKTDYHHIRCTDEIKSSNRINECHMHSILTVDFANHTHVDRQDHAPVCKDKMLDELSSVISHDNLKNKRPARVASHLRTMVDEFDNPLPTVCCYQYCKSDFRSKANISVHAYFPLPSIGVCLRLYDMSSHTFLGGVISHCTSPTVFMESTETGMVVRVGSHPLLSIVAWGTKKKKK